MCPVCKVGLQEKKIGTLIIDTCLSCEGCWYDWGEVEALLQTKRTLLHYVPPGLQNIIHGARPCPFCSREMERLASNTIFPFDVDYCSLEHGVWLDREELHTITEVVEKNRYRFQPREDKSRSEEELVKHAEQKIQDNLDRERNLTELIKKCPKNDFSKVSQDKGPWEDLSGSQKLIVLFGLPVESGDGYQSGAWMNILFLLVNLLVHALVVLSGYPDRIYNAYGFIPSGFTASSSSHFMTLFTAPFLHGGLLHLAGNMYFLFVTGDDIEKRLGHLNYFLFYIFGGILANAVSLFTQNHSTIPHTSGAIAALMGAYTILCPDKRFYITLSSRFSFHFYPQLISIPAFLYLFFWFAMQILSLKYGNPGIDFSAHIAGFLFGLGLGLVVHFSQRYNPDTGRWEWE
jgi:membrane associated rhomboid family serine protease